MYLLPAAVIVHSTLFRYYDEKGDIKDETKFDMPFKYELPEPPGSWALHGDRVIALGTNMCVYNVQVACIGWAGF